MGFLILDYLFSNILILYLVKKDYPMTKTQFDNRMGKVVRVGTFFCFIVIIALIISEIPSFFLGAIYLIIIGLWLSLGLGTLVTLKIMYWLRKDIKETFKEKALGELKAWESIPELNLEESLDKPHLDWFVGFVERLIFSIFVAVSPKPAITAMGVWLALRLATSWHKKKGEDRPFVQLLIRSLALSSLVGGAISLCFAGVGGWLIGTGIRIIWPDFPNICWTALSNLFN